ncbi:MAG: hypothetical protein IJ269_01660, partial [Bacteroidales bacterium]|nr:hypothetical protein [Bacteroidales bacterium]
MQTSSVGYKLFPLFSNPFPDAIGGKPNNIFLEREYEKEDRLQVGMTFHENENYCGRLLYMWEKKCNFANMEEERYDFVKRHFPNADFYRYYDLLCDFRHGGFRLLGDIICDIDDEKKS